MTAKKTTPAAKPEPVDEDQAVTDVAGEPAEMDERDRELARLRDELDALRNPPAPEPEPEPEDPRDRAIAALRAELDAIRSTPEGAAAELAKAVKALQAEVDRMKAGQGLVPVPEPTEPDPYLYWGRLANGDVIEMQHPHATHHHTESHGVVPIRDVWLKDPAYEPVAA